MPLNLPPGAGTGDMLASNNLSEVASQAQARQNIGAAATGALFADITAALNVWAVGDSLTAGAGGAGTTWPGHFATLTGYLVTNGGVGGETSTQIKTRYLADPSKQGYHAVFWAGRNNFTDAPQVRADIAAMIAAHGSNRYLVLSVLNQSTEPAGSGSHTQILALNASLSALYGPRYIDVRGYLINSALAAVGIPPTAQDLLDIAADVVPSSLRSDNIHLNASGYQAVGICVSNAFNAVIASDPNALTPSSLLAIFRAPPVIGGGVRAAGNFSTVAVGTASTFQSGVTLGVRSNFEVKEGLLYISNASGSVVGRMYLSGNGLGFQFDKGLFPDATNARDLGAASLRYKDVWLSGEIYSTAGLRLANTTGGVYFGNQAIKCGPGTPEGAVTAPSGSLWLRTDGGAGTTFYVKESGTGNTGWVAK